MKGCNSKERNWKSDMRELCDVLNRAIANKTEVLLWQNIGENRQVIKARIYHFFLKEYFIVLEIPEWTRGFSGSLKFYVNLPERSTIFSTRMIKRKKDKLFLSFPKSYKLKETRGFLRERFEFGDRVKVVFLHGKGELIGSDFIDFFLFDISACGLGVFIGASKINCFSVGERLSVIMIGRTLVEPRLGVKIIHLSAQGRGIGAHFKMGVQFDSYLDLESLDFGSR